MAARAVVLIAVYVAVIWGAALAAPPADRRIAIPLPGGFRLPPKGVQSGMWPPGPSVASLPQNRSPVYVVQFEVPPTSSEMKMISDAGITVLERLHHASYFIRIPAQLDLDELLARPEVKDRVRAVFAIPPRQKVARALRGSTGPPFVMTRVANNKRAMLVLHRGVFSTEHEAKKWILDTCSLTSLRPFAPPRRWTIIANGAGFDCLAAQSEVQWVRLPPADRMPLIFGIRSASGVEAVHDFALEAGYPRYSGPTGDDVAVAVFDCPPTAGVGGRLHPDLYEWTAGLMVANADSAASSGSRVVVDTESPAPSCPPVGTADDTHGDQVLGLILGSGRTSEGTRIKLDDDPAEPWQFRAIAPSSRATVFNDEPDSASSAFLARAAAEHAIANHSHVTGPLLYDDYSRLLDAAALGFPDLGAASPPRQIVVVSAGNSGSEVDPVLGSVNCRKAQGYFSILGPSKNAITVGAGLYGDDVPPASSRASFSSLGPTLDGRLKPDLIAPACRFTGETFVSPVVGPYVIQTSDSSYLGSPLCGTSHAAPVVTGIVGQLLQVWRTEFAGAQMWPSTAKALLVQSALDMIAESGTSLDPAAVPETGTTAGYPPGPDYATGFGLVRADLALEALRNHRVAQDDVDIENPWEFDFELADGDLASGLRVALAWDDPEQAAVTAVSPAVLNDLDLNVLGPPDEAGNRRVFGAWVPPELLWRVEADVVATDSPDDAIPADDCDPSYDGLDRDSLDAAREAAPDWSGEFDLPAARRCVGRASGGEPVDDWTDVDSGDAVAYDACRDVRNNVERVDIDEIGAGTWTIRVTAAATMTADAPQPFSVSWSVGTRPYTDQFVSGRRCYSLEGFAARSIDRFIPSEIGSCFFIGIEELCAARPGWGLCPQACDRKPCRPVGIDLPEWPWPARVAVYASDGIPVDMDLRGFRHRKALQFVPEPQRKYYLVAFTKDDQPLDKKARRRGFRLGAAEIKTLPEVSVPENLRDPARRRMDPAP